jgi:hypothetical protein
VSAVTPGQASAGQAAVSIPLADLSDREKLNLIGGAAQAYDYENRPRDRNWTAVPLDQVGRLLTGALRAMEFDDPAQSTFTRDELTDALTRLELRVQLTGPIAGMINAESMADAIVEALRLNAAGGVFVDYRCDHEHHGDAYRMIGRCRNCRSPLLGLFSTGHEAAHGISGPTCPVCGMQATTWDRLAAPGEIPAGGIPLRSDAETCAMLRADLADAEALLARWPKCPAGCNCRIGIPEDADANECGCDGPCNAEPQPAPGTEAAR